MLRDELVALIEEILPSRCYVSGYVDRIMELFKKHTAGATVRDHRDYNTTCAYCGQPADTKYG